MTADGATDGRSAVLVTGAYGSGKTSVVEEIAAILEVNGVRFAAIDLDWLAWHTGAHDDDALFLSNLRCVAGNYLDAGITRLVMAGAIGAAAIVPIRDAVRVPVSVVRLDVPLDVVERRLGDDITSGRLDDLESARDQIREELGADVAEITFDNSGPIGATASRIVAWAGWLGGDPS